MFYKIPRFAIPYLSSAMELKDKKSELNSLVKEREINNMQPKTFRDVVIARLLKDADKAFDNEQLFEKYEIKKVTSRMRKIRTFSTIKE